jgi:hypothetical protein
MGANQGETIINRRRLVIAFGAIAIALIGNFACAAPNVVPLPELPSGEIAMRVAYVVNPRLPRMSQAQLQRLLAAAKEAAYVHFGVDLRFAPIKEISIESLFESIPAKRRNAALKQIYDFKSGNGNPDRLAKAFGREFKKGGEPLAGLIEFSRPYIGPLKEESYETVGAALARIELERIERWKTVKALDGGPAIDVGPYNEFTLWDALGYADIPFELVLTNQIIASVEYVNPAAHAAVRGGYTNGITSYSKSARFKSMSIWSTYAFTVDDEWAKQMRDGESYSPEEAARLAGISAVHEIGHQLFHFLHAYGNNACLMNPVPMFAYRAWAENLSPKDCPIGSSAAMRPGAAKILY